VSHAIDFSLGRFDGNSVRELRDVDCRLAAIVLVAVQRYHALWPERRIRVTDGRRTLVEQEALMAAGKSRTINSHHLDGRAVDLAIIARQWQGKVGVKEVALWSLKEYEQLDGFVQQAALDIGFEAGDLLWGGHWTSLRDGVHWQLMLPPL
jgi:hypothetical protein